MNKVFYVGMCFWFLCYGAEYGIIIPIMNEYIISTSAPEAYMGYCVSIYYGSSLVVAILFGRIVDKTQSLKLTYFISVSCAFIGYYIFTFYRTTAGIIIARALAGINNGAYGAIIGRVALDTEKDGASYIGACLLQRELGIVCGSIISGFWISTWEDFTFLNQKVDELNRYGFFCCILYLIAGVIGLIALRNEPRYEISEKIEEKTTTNSEEIQFIQKSKLPYLPEPIIVSLTSSFAILLQQSLLEGTVSSIFKYYLGLTQTQIIMVFSFVGLIALLSYIATILFSLKFHLRYALAGNLSIALACSTLFSILFFFGNFR